MARSLLWEGASCFGLSRLDLVEDGVEGAGGTQHRARRGVLGTTGRWRKLCREARTVVASNAQPAFLQASGRKVLPMDEAFLLPPARVPSSPS